MNGRIFCIFFILLNLLPSLLWAKYVAVLETAADSSAKELVSSADRRYMTDVLRSEAVGVLPAEQNFTIMTRENINVMLPPGKSIEDCEGNCLAETGKNIAADYVAQARVGSFGGSLTLSVELYETAGSKLISSFNGQGSDVNELLQIVKEKAQDFFKKVRGNASGWGTGFVDFYDGEGFNVVGNQSFIVEISTIPEGAAISIDGRPVTKCPKTPCKIQVEEGEHRFVAALDYYEDTEQLIRVSANDQKIAMEMSPNFGTLYLNPQMDGNLGRFDELKLSIDGYSVAPGNFQLAVGVHTVNVTHPCYDPVEFKVGINKGTAERYEEPLVRGKGGLNLSATFNGDAQNVPVYVDGVEVGVTPFLDKVPLCGRITVGNKFDQEQVNVGLLWHETVVYNHALSRSPNAVFVEINERDSVASRANDAYNELENFVWNDGFPKTKQTNAKSQSRVRWIVAGISATVAISGTVLAVVGNSKAKSIREKKPADANEYLEKKDDIHSAQNLRMVGVITAIVGVVGLGVSFAF